MTDELALEGTARDVVRFLQNVRKELGLDVSDRIAVRYAADERGSAVLAAHGEWIAGEVLAQRFERGRRRRSPRSPRAAPRSRFAVERA